MPVLRAATFNIRHGLGMDGRVDLPRTAATLKKLDCDIVAVQEVDVGCQRTGGVDQAAELARLTGMIPCFGPAIPLQGGLYGNLLLSRLPVTLWTVYPLPGQEPRCVVAADLAWAGVALRFCGTHLDYLDAEKRQEALPLLLRVAQGRKLPVVLAGDFNSAADSDMVGAVSALWQMPACVAGPPSYPADSPQQRIDYVFAGPAGAWQVRYVEVVDDAVSSDHRPVRVELELINRGAA